MSRTTKYKGSEVNERIRFLIDNYEDEKGKKGNISKFAKYIGRSKQMVGYWYNGDRTPGIDVIMLLAKKCDVPTDWILGFHDFDNRSSNTKVSDMAKYTGLSSEAIETLHQFQADSDYEIAQKYRRHVRRVIHLLSWIIVHDRDINNLSELTAKSLFDEIYSYFFIDKTRSLEIHDLQKIVNNEDSLIGKFDKDELMIGQLPFYDPFTVEDYEIQKLMSIQRRIEHLKEAYWKEMYQEQERIEKTIKDEPLKETIEVASTDTFK